MSASSVPTRPPPPTRSDGRISISVSSPETRRPTSARCGSTPMAEASRAEVCVVACAEAWRGDGEILASPMGLVPTIGCRLAKLTFAPDLLISDGEAYLLGEVPPAGPEVTAPTIEAWLPHRAVFDVVASGRRHVMMGASQ